MPAPASAIVGVMILLAVLCLRVLVSYDPTPGWSGDPLELESPIVGLTPMGSLTLDALTLLAATLILAAMSRRGHAPPLWQTLCLAAGATAIALHARVLPDASLPNLVTGSSWLAAFTGAFAATQAARDPRLRGLIIATLLGLIAPLVIKGAVQYFIEQPETAQEFLRNKDRILSANGWTPDSPMARAYQRRLEQPEATGWFGLSNVFATLAAAALPAVIGLNAGLSFLRRPSSPDPVERRQQRSTTTFLTLAAVLAATGVYLAGSKGGYAAAALGLAIVALSQASTHFRLAEGRTQTLGGLIALSAPALALAAIALRGVLSTRLHELSLLFRWFYIETAARIFSSHPLLGTGPDGFKDAYMLLKPAISPEDVSSPHSIFFDLAARLGLAGLALSALLIAWLWHTGRSLAPTKPSAEEPTLDNAPRILLLTIAAATAAAALLEHAAATPASSLVRAGGIAGFMLIAVGVLRVMRRPAVMAGLGNPALAAAAIAAFTHSQIELTGTTPGANLWLFLALAAGAAAAQPRAVPSTPARLLAPTIPLAALALLIAFALAPAITWDRAMRRAYQLVEPLSSMSIRAEAIARNKPFPTDSAQALATDLSKELGRPVAPTHILQACAELRYTRAVAALNGPLATAMQTRPPDPETYHAAARLMLQLAVMEQRSDTPAQASSFAQAAETLAHDFSASIPPSPAHLAWLGMIRRARFELDRSPAHLADAIQAWEQAAALAPHEPLYQLQLARACETLGNHQAAAAWARRALDTNADLFLDPLRQFSAPEVDELQRLAGGT